MRSRKEPPEAMAASTTSMLSSRNTGDTSIVPYF
jgi:hypothetical protein